VIASRKPGVGFAADIHQDIFESVCNYPGAVNFRCPQVETVWFDDLPGAGSGFAAAMAGKAVIRMAMSCILGKLNCVLRLIVRLLYC
jgi:hypothetical protein